MKNVFSSIIQHSHAACNVSDGDITARYQKWVGLVPAGVTVC